MGDPHSLSQQGSQLEQTIRTTTEPRSEIPHAAAEACPSLYLTVTKKV
jgi:hypothetical protein